MATLLETEQPEAKPRRRHAWALWSLGAVLVALLALPIPLIAPPPEPDIYLCGEFRPVIGDHGFVKNCDSVAFWRLAEHPDIILREGHPRQSRPLFIGLGAVTRAVASPFAVLVGFDGPTSAAQVGYLGLNIALLAAAIGLVGWLLRAVHTPWPIMAALFAVLVANNIIKAFIWTAHTQIFNLLLPVALVAIVTRTVGAGFPQRRRFLIALGLGTLVLAYGSFLAGLPLLLISGEISRRRSGNPMTREVVLREAGLSAVFVAPTVLWVGFITLHAGSFYSLETSRYRQFVWVFDAAESGLGELVSQSVTFTGDYRDTLFSGEIAPFLVLTAIALISFLLRRRAGVTPSPAEADLQLAALLTAATLALFLWPLGFYAQRISFSIVPALLIFMAVEGHLRWKEPSLTAGGVLLVAATGWTVVHLVQSGPYN